MLESQCDSWTGVTSAAVYMSLVQYKPNNTNLVKSAGKKIQRFHQKMERESTFFLLPACSSAHRAPAGA